MQEAILGGSPNFDSYVALVSEAASHFVAKTPGFVYGAYGEKAQVL
jgi:hypothetical protein